MKFDELGLSPKVLEAVSKAGYDEPTPIQAGAIPIAVTGRDVLGIAQTGTGKTASFVLPMLTRLERGRARARMPRSLILAPTRELAAQVHESFEQYGAKHKLNVALLIGGVAFDEQIKKLDRGADVLIATPGRLLDHFGRGRILMTGVDILVIDEADRMLDMGFIPDIEKICGLLPTRRQTLFFSATMPPEIQRLVKKFLKDPARVEVARQSTAASTITQRFKRVSSDPREKRAALRALLREYDIKNAIIFCNRKRDVTVLLKSLQKHGFDVGALHGDMEQYQRMAMLDAFRNGEVQLLAASDVAARGLDIPDVSHIFNFDVPVQAEDYVHRIGRTGRAGREGYSVTLVTGADRKVMRGIEGFSDEPIQWLDDTPDTASAEKSGGAEGESEGDRGRRGRARGRRGRGSSESRDGNRGASRSRSDSADAGDERSESHAEVDSDSGPTASSQEREPAPRPRNRRRARSTSDETPAPAPAPATSRSEAADTPKRKRGGRGRGRPDDANSNPSQNKDGTIGLGDHVPDFLKRS